LALNPPSTDAAPVNAGKNSIEAPFIFSKGKYYYLFVSWDYCCKGPASDYKIAVGRSEKITGPYLDKKGVDMAKGGGTIVREGDGKEFFGLGHNAAYTFNGIDYLVYHGYKVMDATNNRTQNKLVIEKLNWDKDGWPVVGERVVPAKP
jgi:arabinan endo-1,5-alpha-L-arabinosidase